MFPIGTCSKRSWALALGVTLFCAAPFPLAAQVVADPALDRPAPSERRSASAPASALDHDVYLAADPAEGALVIFVQSRFWNERQPDALIEGGFVRGLVEAGHSAAILRPRLGAAGRHPAAAQDVARGVATLLERVEAGEFPADRVFLAGHSSGAQLALLVALDPAWLAAEGKSPKALAGVISLSGIVDLAPDSVGSPEEELLYAAAFPDGRARSAASPAALVNPDVPAILLLSAARDIPGSTRTAKRYAEAARAHGQPAIEVFVANGRDHFSILDLSRRSGVQHVFDLLESRPRSGALPEMWQIVSAWRTPPHTTAEFYEGFSSLVEKFEADAHFVEALNRPFMTKSNSKPRLRVAAYEAIPLIELLEALGPARAGRGEWLVLTNVRGEQAYYSMERIRALAPRVVVGLGDGENLFKATDLYHTRRRYSWVDAQESRIDMARPLGAFLYFPGEDPANAEWNALLGRYALTVDSFRLQASDPLEGLGDLPPLVRAALVEEHDCVSCHRFRDVGGRAFHIRARDAAPVGGHAMPLERYPAVVWKRFVFDQARVAEEVGATPVRFMPIMGKALYDFVVAERERRGIEPWIRPDRDLDPPAAP